MKLLEGERREGDGWFSIAKSYSEEQEEAMRRLLDYPGIANTWQRLQNILDNERALIRFFDYAWAAHLDYDFFRIVPGSDQAKLLNGIKETAQHLSELVIEFDSLGGCFSRPSA